MVSGSRETPAWCMIYDELEYEHETDIFANQMKYVKPLLPYEVFMTNIEADSDKHIIIKELVESYNLAITPSAMPNGICTIATLEKIYDCYGLQTLDRILRLCIGTWEGAPQSFSSNMLNGVARLVNAFGDDLNDIIFKEKVDQCSVKVIAKNAKDRRPGSAGYSEALLLAYNKSGRSINLPFDQLFTHKINKEESEDNQQLDLFTDENE